MRFRFRILGVFAVLFFVIGAAASTAAPSVPFDSSAECMECHSVAAGGPAVTTVDFGVASVDYFSCSGCHWISPTDLIDGDWSHSHFQIDPTTACADCHDDPDYPEEEAYYTPDTLTVFGYFDTAVSLSTSPDELHRIHVNGSWPRFANTFPRYCSSCHQPAACSTCHTGAVPHTDHTYDEDTSAYVYPPVSYVQALGTTPGDPNQLNFPNRSTTCATAECHPPASAVVGLQVPECSGCHPTKTGVHSGASHDAVDAGDIDAGCAGCHFSTLDTEHLSLGYSCGTCHQSADPTVTGAISSGDRDCLTCHPASAHNLAHDVEFDPANGSMHRVEVGLPGMRDSFTYGAATYTWTRPSEASFLRPGLTYTSMVGCGSCHSYSGADGPHGATMKVNIDPRYPVDWKTMYLGKSASQIICSKCHTLNYTSMNAVHKEIEHKSPVTGQCGNCHVQVPHGWARPRLLGSTDDPAPYATKSGALRAISLENHAPFTWKEDDCEAACWGDHWDELAQEWPDDPTWTVPAATSGSVVGEVSDSVTGDPVSGASVSLSGGGAATSKADGGYAIPDVPEGEYQLTVQAPGYILASAPAPVVAGSVTTVDVALDPVPAGPVDLASGKPFYAFKWVRPFNAPSMAGDDNVLTHWRSALWGDELDRDLLWVDLQTTSAVKQVEIVWADGLWASEFNIYTSTNGTNWRRVYVKTGALAGTSSATFAAVDARYVRLECRRTGTGRGVGYGVSELRVFAETP